MGDGLLLRAAHSLRHEQLAPEEGRPGDHHDLPVDGAIDVCDHESAGRDYRLVLALHHNEDGEGTFL